MVANVTGAIASLQGNIADASMTRLGGEFSMMMVCDFPGQGAAPLAKALKPIEKKLGLQCQIKMITPALAKSASGSPARFMISVYGHDRAGIVHRVTQALAQRKLSVTDLNTRAVQQGSNALYLMLIEVAAPENLDVDDLRDELDRIRQDLNVEITFQDIEPVIF